MRATLITTAVCAFAATVAAQQVGTSTAESHPKLTVYNCQGTSGTSCTASSQSIVLDANWRWLHNTDGYTNCYTGNKWDATYCPDDKTCAQKCALDGADYSGTYGITTSGDKLKLSFKTGSNVGSRTYLMDSSDSKYQIFKLMNKEFSFDVDVSTTGCGINGALYFVEMPADGQLGVGNNKAGAKYGTGYCDGQCPRDLKFINGEANVEGWKTTDENSGNGNYGSCCAEMDVWEANKFGSAYTPHPATITGLQRCTGASCGGLSGTARYGSAVDPDGCDFNTWRMGNQTFYGPGLTVDTTKPFTVVTQFISTDGTDSGDLKEIRRYYVQNGKAIANSYATFPAVSKYDSVTQDFCDAQKTLFGDTNDFTKKGGLKGMGAALKRGMVLVMSIWDDVNVAMLWLDSNFPTDADASKPGISRGPCATTSGKPADVRSQYANAWTSFANIRFGPIGSTNALKPGNNPPPPPASTTTGGGVRTTTTAVVPPRTSTRASPTTTAGGSGGNCAAKWGQCGGQGFTGPKCCQSGSTCTTSNPYYSQCL